MALKLLEISIMLLEVLGKLHEKDPYADGIDYNEVCDSEGLKEYSEKLKDAAILLEEDGYVKCYLTNDKSIYSIGITTAGKKRLEQRIERKTKPTEIEIIIKDLISESNPDRPREMELHKTNDFYNKINNLENTEAKIDYLQQILDGIEHYFIKKWIKNDRPGNYINGFPIVYWKKTIKGYYLYKKIKGMIEKLIDDPSFEFPQRFNTYKGAMKALDEYRREYKTQNRLFWENHLFIDIIDIKNYLGKLQNDEKLDFLDFHLHELNQICYHYTDDNIEAILDEHGLTDKFTRIEYSPYSDYTHSHISKSEYRVFLTHLKDHVVPYMRNEKRRLEGIDAEKVKEKPSSESSGIPKADLEVKIGPKDNFPEKVNLEGTNISITFKNPYILTEITGWIIDNTKHFSGQVIDLTDSEYKTYKKSIKIEPYGEIWKPIIDELQRYDSYDDKINCLKKVKAKFEFDQAYPTGNNTFINYINERLSEYMKKQRLLNAIDDSTPEKKTKQVQDFKAIQWHGSKNQLLELFKMLNENKPEYTSKYSQNEIFYHFVDQRGNKYINVSEIQTQKLQWKTADGEFWQLVNLLVDNNFIKKHKKYQIFIPHFLNKDLQIFKNPAQTNYFKENFLNPDDNLTAIINKVLLIKD